MLTDSLSLARWAGEERQVGPSLRFRPMVMGPAQVPRVEDLQEAAAHPSRAVLSAVIHGRSHDGGPVAWAAMGALTGFDDATAARYADIIWSHLSKGARLFLEGLVSITPAYEIQSPFLRKLIATGEARGEARGERTAMECFIEERFPAELPDLSELLGACPDAELKSLMRQLFSARTPAEARQTLMRGRPH